MNINQTFELKNGNRQYNYLKYIQYLQQQGRICMAAVTASTRHRDSSYTDC